MVDLLNRLAGLSKDEVRDVEDAFRLLCMDRMSRAGFARLGVKRIWTLGNIDEADAAYDRAKILYQRFMNKEYK